MKRWYVVQVYAGYEEAVKVDIEKSIKEKGLQHYFGDLLIPSAKLKTMLASVDSEDQQLFPGYLLIEMELVPEALRLVQLIPKVNRVLGGKDPIPLAKKEVERINSQMKGEVALASKKSEFMVGSEIEISAGPFAGFDGVINEVDEANERLTVMVSIFGRMTPIALGFDQVKR